MPTFTGSGTSATGAQGSGPSVSLMVQELGRRMQEFLPSNPNAGGLATTLIDPNLRQFFPNDIAQLNAWVYAGAGADGANVGLERRVQSWAASTATATFYPPGWPTAPSAGIYEWNIRFQRSRLLEAINDAVGQLGLTWFREVVDQSLVTLDHTWAYVPPAVQNWSNIQRIEIQINTDTNLTGYPFVSAEYLNWRARRAVDTLGVESWVIDFGLLPPIGRALRIFGEAFYSDLQFDTDALAIAGEWRRPALTWIYAWASFNLNDWSTNSMVSTEVEKVRQKSLDQLQNQKTQLLATAPPHRPGRIITPGRGDAQPIESPEDGSYLGVFRSAGFSH